MGENEDKEQQKAIEFALLKQEVDNLKIWRDSYEKAQQDKFERIQEENKEERLQLEEKLDKFMENLTKQISELTLKINDQKENWMSKAPWWLVILITALFTTLGSLGVYLVTKK